MFKAILAPLAAVLALSPFSTPAHAQFEQSALSLSPLAKVSQAVGVSTMTIEYSRPSVRGREVFGDLEPFGQVWRTGANASTKITTSHAFTFGTTEVAPGTYALYSIPGKKSWTVILSRDTSLWGAAGYDPKNDAARFEVKPKKLQDSRETFTIDLDGLAADRASLTIAWDTTLVSVPIRFQTDEEMQVAIDERIRKAQGKVDPAVLYGAGMYMYDRFLVTGDKNALAEALDWVGKAADQNPQAFWQMYFKAEIAEAAGQKKVALEAAKKALAGAKQAGQRDFGYAAKTALLMKKLK